MLKLELGQIGDTGLPSNRVPAAIFDQIPSETREGYGSFSRSVCGANTPDVYVLCINGELARDVDSLHVGQLCLLAAV